MPIIALTAQVVGAKADAWREAGMDGVVYKPYTLLQLAACFDSVFGQRSDSREHAHLDRSSSDASEGRTAPLDAGVLQDLRDMGGGANPNFLRRIFDLYLENAAPARDEMLRAAHAGDVEACARAAHALKSMSYNVGAAQVAAGAGGIECRAHAQGEVVAAELDGLVQLLDATLKEIAVHREQAAAAERNPRTQRRRMTASVC